jgi:hypothetical protein
MVPGVGTWCPYRMIITRGVKEWYLAFLQNDDHSWSKRMVPGVGTWCPYRMMITRGVKEWYLAFLQNDDHSWSKRMVLFFYSTSDHHSVRTPGTILLLHE